MQDKPEDQPAEPTPTVPGQPGRETEPPGSQPQPGEQPPAEQPGQDEPGSY